MKKIIFTIVFIISIIDVNAQGNLQFNQVKLISTSETVPVGKVWKMENFLPNVSLYTDLNRQPSDYVAGGIKQFNILINGNSIFLLTTLSRELGRTGGYWSQDAATTAASASILSQPIWLPAGTSLAPSTNIQYLSVIEFNVIQ